jgi:Na+-transporting NADH:ubiquinone oxidoreductase subunit NqrA
MRLWSVHPKYLDTKGLVALWRETLLARNVLEGKTKGYKNHPQLIRFKTAESPVDSINYYLEFIWIEAKSRKYSFDRNKFKETSKVNKINLTSGQLNFEVIHLLKKLKSRDINKYEEVVHLDTFNTHPLFNLIEGDIEKWEKI